MEHDDREPRSAGGDPLDDDELRSMPTEENSRIGESGLGGGTCTSGWTILCDDKPGPTCKTGFTILCDSRPGPTCTYGFTLKCDSKYE